MLDHVSLVVFMQRWSGRTSSLGGMDIWFITSDFQSRNCFFSMKVTILRSQWNLFGKLWFGLQLIIFGGKGMLGFFKGVALNIDVIGEIKIPSLGWISSRLESFPKSWASWTASPNIASIWCSLPSRCFFSSFSALFPSFWFAWPNGLFLVLVFLSLYSLQMLPVHFIKSLIKLLNYIGDYTLWKETKHKLSVIRKF